MYAIRAWPACKSANWGAPKRALAKGVEPHADGALLGKAGAWLAEHKGRVMNSILDVLFGGHLQEACGYSAWQNRLFSERA